MSQHSQFSVCFLGKWKPIFIPDPIYECLWQRKPIFIPDPIHECLWQLWSHCRLPRNNPKVLRWVHKWTDGGTYTQLTLLSSKNEGSRLAESPRHLTESRLLAQKVMDCMIPFMCCSQKDTFIAMESKVVFARVCRGGKRTPYLRRGQMREVFGCYGIVLHSDCGGGSGLLNTFVKIHRQHALQNTSFILCQL